MSGAWGFEEVPGAQHLRVWKGSLKPASRVLSVSSGADSGDTAWRRNVNANSKVRTLVHVTVAATVAVKCPKPKRCCCC